MSDEWKLPPFQVEQQFVSLAQILDWGVRDLGIPELWPEFGQGEGARVVILDTGLPDHKDLIEALGASKDFTNSASGVKDRQGHSTHCSGIVGARNNDQASVGVAPKCEILCGKVLGDSGSGASAGIAAGIDWAIQQLQGEGVISMSLGSPSPSPVIFSAVNRIPPGIVLCCAAGNAGPGESFDFPGAWERSESVASSNQAREISRFSSRNSQVDIAAPGELITSTWLNDQVAKLSGTSMATPYVAGLAALAISYCKRTGRPKLTHDIFVRLLAETADDIGFSGPDPSSGAGLVNPKRFFARVKAIPIIIVPPPPPPGVAELIVSVVGAPLPVGVYKYPSSS